jgi:hypothetical protein
VIADIDTDAAEIVLLIQLALHGRRVRSGYVTNITENTFT